MPKPKTEPQADQLPFQAVNAEELARNLLRLFEQGGNVLTEFIERNDAKMGPYSAAAEITEATNTLSDLARQWFADPARFAESQGTLLRSYGELWNNTVYRMFGQDVVPVAEPEPGDSRFKDPEWSANPYFDFWKQAYLVTAKWAEDMLQNTEGLDGRTRQRAEFYLRQVASALSPSNFPLTNPEVLRETLATNAENLVQGMSLLVEDMRKSGDLLKVSQTDTTAFEVGRNLATTPGKVVYQNDIFQLIQYSPTTDKVREIPLLMVPPWINKYYILDLTPAKSQIKFLVDQGLTVFIISWVNPDASLSHKSFEDYMQEGILTAADAVKRETGVDQINVVGYCVGGTLLATTLAYLAARGEEVFNTASFLATQVDFTNAGDLLLFTDTEQLESLNQLMSERGYFDGSRMANVFNMLRPRDLIWPYIVNNYLLGKKPFPFDLLYWNQDFDAHDGRQPQLLSARILQRQLPRQGQPDDRRHAPRHAQGEAPRLRVGHERGSHRPRTLGVCWRAAVRRRGRVRAVGVGPHRRRRQPAGQDEVSVLGRRQARQDARAVASLGQGASRLVVAALGRMARRALGRMDRAARAGRKSRRHRGRPRHLRQGQVITTRSKRQECARAAIPNIT